jgi:nucleoid-associated protein YgaU
VAGVVLFALYRRAHPAAAAAGAAATDSTGALTSSDGIAGLSGSPDTSSTDFGNALQDAINQAVSTVQGQLTTPTPPPAPAVPTPISSPGTGLYTIKAGDTLAKIAANVYGTTNPARVTDLKRANPTLWGWNPTAKLDYFAGHTLKVPRASAAK